MGLATVIIKTGESLPRGYNYQRTFNAFQGGGINVLLVLPEVLQIDKSGYRACRIRPLVPLSRLMLSDENQWGT